MDEFFKYIKSTLFKGVLYGYQLDSIMHIIEFGKKYKVTYPQLAYVLATVYHEVGIKMLPVEENLNYSAKGLANNWSNRYAEDPKAKIKVPNALARKLAGNPEAIANNCYANRMGNGSESSGDGWKFRGRGDCQATGRSAYEWASKLTGVDLIKNPERMLESFIATWVMFEGMVKGRFTTKKLSDYINVNVKDYYNSRKIINSLDRAELIAGYAIEFEKGLKLVN